MTYLVEKSAWDKLARLMRTAEREVFLAYCGRADCSCDFLHDSERISIEERLIRMGLLQRNLRPTDKGFNFASHIDPIYEQSNAMTDRIKLIRSLIDKRDWVALNKTLYSNEREVFIWVSDPHAHDIPLPAAALDECLAALSEYGLIAEGPGPTSLSLDGERFLLFLTTPKTAKPDSTPSFDIKRAAMLNQLTAKKDWDAIIDELRPEELAILRLVALNIPLPDEMTQDVIDTCRETLVLAGLITGEAGSVRFTHAGIAVFDRFAEKHAMPYDIDERVKELKAIFDSSEWRLLFLYLSSAELDFLCFIAGDSENGLPMSLRIGNVLSNMVDMMKRIGIVVCTTGHPIVFSYKGETFYQYLKESGSLKSQVCEHSAESKKYNDCLEEAGRIVRGSREDTYGPAERNLSRIAEMWSAYLSMPLTARQVAVMMVLLKASRDAFKPKHDNMVDICGYAYLADILDKGTSLK